MSALETDMLLLKRFSEAGDHAAFAEIIRRYAGLVSAACQRILLDPARADDVSQGIRAAIEALQDHRRNRGLSLAPLALTGLLHDHALQAVPAALTAELGKMTMVSGARSLLEAAYTSSAPSVGWLTAGILGAS